MATFFTVSGIIAWVIIGLVVVGYGLLYLWAKAMGMPD